MHAQIRENKEKYNYPREVDIIISFVIIISFYYYLIYYYLLLSLLLLWFHSYYFIVDDETTIWWSQTISQGSTFGKDIYKIKVYSTSDWNPKPRFCPWSLLPVFRTNEPNFNLLSKKMFGDRIQLRSSLSLSKVFPFCIHFCASTEW